jgi:hypothetical protein
MKYLLFALFAMSMEHRTIHIIRNKKSEKKELCSVEAFLMKLEPLEKMQLSK